MSAVLLLGWLSGAAAVPVVPRATTTEVIEGLSIVGDDDFLISVELQLVRTWWSRDAWTDEVIGARFELLRDGREVHYDSRDDPAAIGATWTVDLQDDGTVTLSHQEIGVTWLDDTLLRHLARRVLLLPRRVRRDDPPPSPAIVQAHCDGPCVTTWTLEERSCGRRALTMSPEADGVDGSGTLVLDRDGMTLEYTTRIAGDRPTTVIGALSIRRF